MTGSLALLCLQNYFHSVISTVYAVFQVLTSVQDVEEENSSPPVDSDNHHSCEHREQGKALAYLREEPPHGEAPHPYTSSQEQGQCIVGLMRRGVENERRKERLGL